MKKLYQFLRLSFLLICLSPSRLSAQTNPTAQVLPHSQPFTITTTSTVYPNGWQGWTLNAAPSNSFNTSVPTGNQLLIASGTAANTAAGIYNYNTKIGIHAEGTTDVSLVAAVATTGSSNVILKFDIMTIRNQQDASNNRISQVDVQYRVGTSGVFTSASGNVNGIYENNTVNQVTGTTGQNILFKSFTLPAACNNQPIVQLRWVQRDSSGIGSRPGFAVDNVCITVLTTPSIIITGNTTFCGTTSRFVATTVNGGTAPVYQWKKNGVVVGTSSNTLDIGSLAVNDVINCTLTTNVACVTSSSAVSNNITIIKTASLPIISSALITPVGCTKGAIDISIAGGLAPYTACWDTTNIVNGAMFAVTLGVKTASNPYIKMQNYLIRLG